MDTQYFKGQARHVRDLAEKADPFTKKRHLTLAEHYDPRVLVTSPALPPFKPQTRLPAVTFGGDHPNDPGHSEKTFAVQFPPAA